MDFLKSWLWKREGKNDRERYQLPYTYFFSSEVSFKIQNVKQLLIHQDKAIAKTVWDSSIVLSKYFEKLFLQENNNFNLKESKCLELGCGCGLVSLVLASLGGNVIMTDLQEEIEIAEKNLKENAKEAFKNRTCEVKALEWGNQNHLNQFSFFDIIIGTDILYIPELVQPLIETIQLLSHHKTLIYFAYGRNRSAEELFKTKLQKLNFQFTYISVNELDEVYQSEEISVVLIQKTTIKNIGTPTALQSFSLNPDSKLISTQEENQNKRRNQTSESKIKNHNTNGNTNNISSYDKNIEFQNDSITFNLKEIDKKKQKKRKLNN